MGVLSTHFTKVFDSNVNIDWIILTEIKQTPVFKNIDTEVQYNEYSFAINKLTLHRAAGYNGISPNVIKALDKENRNLYLKYILIFSKTKLISKNGKLEYWKYYQKRRYFQSQQLAGN